jgi:hypothetical protein
LLDKSGKVAAVPFWEISFCTTTLPQAFGAQSELLATGTTPPSVHEFDWASTMIASFAGVAVAPLTLGVACGAGAGVAGGGVTVVFPAR